MHNIEIKKCTKCYGENITVKRISSFIKTKNVSVDCYSFRCKNCTSTIIDDCFIFACYDSYDSSLNIYWNDEPEWLLYNFKEKILYYVIEKSNNIVYDQYEIGKFDNINDDLIKSTINNIVFI